MQRVFPRSCNYFEACTAEVDVDLRDVIVTAMAVMVVMAIAMVM